MNLPNIFQNKNIKEPENIQKLFYKKHNDTFVENNEVIDIDSKIKSIFKSKKYVYKIDVTIVLKNKKVDTTLVGKSSGYLITYDNELIPIRDIKDIYLR